MDFFQNFCGLVGKVKYFKGSKCSHLFYICNCLLLKIIQLLSTFQKLPFFAFYKITLIFMKTVLSILFTFWVKFVHNTEWKFTYKHWSLFLIWKIECVFFHFMTCARESWMSSQRIFYYIWCRGDNIPIPFLTLLLLIALHLYNSTLCC